MVGIYQRKLFIVFFILIIFSLALLYLLRITTYHIFIDTRIESAKAEELRCELLGMCRSVGYRKACALFQEKHPWIHTITACITQPHSLTCTIKIADPWFRVNDHQILCSNGKMCDKKDVESSCCTSLAALESHCPLERKSLIEWLESLDGHILNSYKICIKDPLSINLESLTDHQYHIVCNQHTSLTQALLESCQQLYEQSLAHNPLKHMVVADVRFAGQIILRKQKGGV